MRSTDFRIQIDIGGFKLGSHPDSPKKIVTLQLYFPNDNAEEKVFGTCLYTQRQHEMWKKRNSEAKEQDERNKFRVPCETKFPFTPNTGYAFKVGAESFHGVEIPFGKRRTLLINWYETSRPVGDNWSIFPSIFDVIRGEA